MRSNRRNLSDEELRKLLKLGDPAGDGNDSTTDEIAAMRRTILNAVDSGAVARPWLSRSLVTASATVAVALVALTILLRTGPWGEVLQPETGPATPAESEPAAATGPTPTALPEPVASLDEGAAEVVTAPPTDPTVVADVPHAAENPPAIASADDSQGIVSPTVEREPRTVQFTAPGGTRIIWTLDPDFELPESEPDDRARGEL